MKYKSDQQSRLTNKDSRVVVIAIVSAMLGDILLGLFAEKLGSPYTEIVMVSYMILIVVAALAWLLSREKGI